MNQAPTKFELEVLEATLKQHAANIRLEELNLSQLKVIRRKPSGAGSYIVFDREGQPPPRADVFHQLGFAGEINVPGVPSGLGAIVDVESGQLNHIEFFTYGNESWDGDTSNGIVLSETEPQSPK